MSLKVAIADDIQSVFLNTFEFAEEIVLDDVEMLAVATELNIEADNDRNGVSFLGVRLFLDKSYITKTYTPHCRVIYNGEVWYCLETKERMGMLELDLYRECS